MSQKSMTRETLLRLGFIYPAMMGLQPDLNPAWLKEGSGWREGSFCDHNCVTGDGLDPQGPNGGYNCFAAADENKGIVPTSMAGFQQLRRWIDNALAGQRLWRDAFLESRFSPYCEKYEVPADVAKLYWDAISEDNHEVNLFGGNPELNNAWMDLIPYLKMCGHRVNFTTTGGRFMREPDLLDMLLSFPPDMLAVSADDLTTDEVHAVSVMSLEELAAMRQIIPRKRGQDRKAIEGLWMAKYAERTPGFPPILFNTVIHEKNVFESIDMIQALRETFPHAMVNPYFAQSSMYYGVPVFDYQHLLAVEWLIDRAIIDTIEGARVPKRLPYYLYLKAIFHTFADSPHVIPEWLAGYHGWQCYRPDAAWYLQFGRDESVFVVMQGLTTKMPKFSSYAPGGHLGCTWNSQTVTQVDQIMGPEQVRDYLKFGMQLSAGSAPNPCQGCNMPRLMFHAIAIESGMDPVLWPAYHALRQQYVGF